MLSLVQSAAIELWAWSRVPGAARVSVPCQPTIGSLALSAQTLGVGQQFSHVRGGGFLAILSSKLHV